MSVRRQGFGFGFGFGFRVRLTPVTSWANPYTTGLLLQLMAEACAGADGASVALYVDVSGHANHGSASGSAEAVIKRAVVNGRDGLLFNGTGNFYALTSPLVATGDWTIFAVQQRATTSDYMLGLASSTTDSPYGPFQYTGGLTYGSNSAGYINTGVDDATLDVWSLKNSSGSLSLYRNGVLLTPANFGTSIGATTFDTVGARLIGGEHSKGYRFADLFYSAALSDTNRFAVEDSLLTYFLGPKITSVYVSQSGSGTGSGSDGSNTKSVSWLNDSANWGGSYNQIAPGCVIHLCGTISTGITILGSGTSSALISVLFEPGCKMSAPTWPAINSYGGGAISVIGQDYIDINGDISGGRQGVIECTDNGTSKGHQVASCAVGGATAKHFTARNLTIQNIYVRTGTTDTAGGGVGVQNTCTHPGTNGLFNITNFRVTNCVMFELGVGIDSDYGPGCSTYEFDGNEVYNANWGGRCGDRNSSSTMTGLRVHGNYFHDWENWNETVNDTYHHNGFYAWAESGGNMTDAQFYGNTVGPNYGGQYSTSGIFISGNVSNGLLYNNLFVANSGDAPANGMITIGVYDGYGGMEVANNTFIGGGTGNAIAAGSGNGSYTIKNNLATACTFVLFNNAASSTLIADYNVGWGLISGQEYSFSATGSSDFKSFAQWQALGYDAHGSNATPALTAGYVPTASDTVAKGKGADLSTLFTTDFNGTTRTTPWDIGAFVAEV